MDSDDANMQGRVPSPEAEAMTTAVYDVIDEWYDGVAESGPLLRPRHMMLTLTDIR